MKRSFRSSLRDLWQFSSAPGVETRAIFDGSSGTKSHHTQFIRNHERDLRGSGHQIKRDAHDLKCARSLTATHLGYLFAED